LGFALGFLLGDIIERRIGEASTYGVWTYSEGFLGNGLGLAGYMGIGLNNLRVDL
jgi:hypothetical protein